MKISIFTDGSSRGNPGPGGWAAVIVLQQEGSTEKKETRVIELGGGEKSTTNNRMELMAAIQGLKKVGNSLKSVKLNSPRIEILTDSSYLINGITKWIKGWKRNGWISKVKGDILNKGLWVELDKVVHEVESAQILNGAKIVWKYVGGHVGILGNERADHIATAFADGMGISLYDGPLAAYDLPDILDISHNMETATKKKSDSSRSKAKAYSYVSNVGGVIETHHTWAECEKHVSGARGARYKKALDADDEKNIIREFEAV